MSDIITFHRLHLYGNLSLPNDPLAILGMQDAHQQSLLVLDTPQVDNLQPYLVACERFAAGVYKTSRDIAQDPTDLGVPSMSLWVYNEDKQSLQTFGSPPSASPFPLSPAHDQLGNVDIDVTLHAEALKGNYAVPDLITGLVTALHVQEKSSELSTLVTEVFSNAFEHGVLGLDSKMKSTADGMTAYYTERQKRLEDLRDGFLRFAFRYDASKHRLYLTCTDSGPGFDFQKVLDSFSTCPSESVALFGRGLRLVHSIVESLEFTHNGRCIQLTYAL